MNEQKKDDVKTNKKRGKLYGIVSSVAIFCIIVFLAKFLGRKAGRQAAMQTVQRESIEQNAPTGFMGAKWLMQMSQVKSLFPDAIKFSQDDLKLDSNAFGRPAFIDFMFTDDLLIMIIISFKGEKTESTYRQTHVLVKKEYGGFPDPSSDSENILVSKKRFGRIVIEHVLHKPLGVPIEQVMLYRTKENNSY